MSVASSTHSLQGGWVERPKQVINFIGRRMQNWDKVKPKDKTEYPITSKGRPARATMALPSPVHVWAEVAEKYALP